MYPLRYAAAMLGISQSTLRSWITQTNIPTIKLPIDGERVYIKHQDLIELAATHQHKIAPVTTLTNRPKNHPDPDLYTLAETAQCLDVSLYTLRIWLKQDNIEKRYITTDRKRIYITLRDIAILIYKHRWKRNYNTNTTTPKDPSDQGLCTIHDAARYLGVHPNTIRIWLTQHNISKKLRITDKRRTYIEEQDVLQLANLHARKPKTLDLCSIKEAAQYLGVSSQTVVIWLEQHNILTHIIGTTGQRICIRYTDVIRLEHLHPKKPTDPALLTPKEAAAFVGVSKPTLEKWLVQYDIPKQRPDPTNRRVYIHALDIIPLEMQYQKRRADRDFLTPKQAAAYLGISKSTLEKWLIQHDITKYCPLLSSQRVYLRRTDVVELARLHSKKPPDNSLLTLTEAAAHLGISRSTLDNWLTQHGMSKYSPHPTSQRVYIHRTDVVELARLHPKKPTDNSLLTLTEAAAHLGISKQTLRRWLTRHAIPKQRIDPTSQRVYIHHTDVAKLEQLHLKHGIRKHD